MRGGGGGLREGCPFWVLEKHANARWCVHKVFTLGPRSVHLKIASVAGELNYNRLLLFLLLMKLNFLSVGSTRFYRRR